jgi:hypothetical protein
MSNVEYIDDLLKRVAAFHEITVMELREKSIKQKLFDQYYLAKGRLG